MISNEREQQQVKRLESTLTHALNFMRTAPVPEDRAWHEFVCRNYQSQRATIRQVLEAYEFSGNPNRTRNAIVAGNAHELRAAKLNKALLQMSIIQQATERTRERLRVLELAIPSNVIKLETTLEEERLHAAALAQWKAYVDHLLYDAPATARQGHPESEVA